MPVLDVPLSPSQQSLLRRAVVEHARSATRGAHDPVVRVGRPGGDVRALTLGPGAPPDHALCADVVAAMVAALVPPAGEVHHADPWVWLGRPGELSASHDLDSRWLAAATTAYAEAGLDLTLVVVNRRGWRDPRSGVGRSWARLRV